MAEPLRVGLSLKITFATVAAAALAMGAICNSLALGRSPERPDIADFNVFMLAGRLVTGGRLSEAYRMVTMFPLEKALSGHDSFMPWSYPPLFGLALAPLAQLPLALAYLLFTGATLGLYLLVMRRLGPSPFWPVILAVAPAILLNIRLGQNGLLTGGLLGLAALYMLGGRPRSAGIAIGVLAIKPHLAVMVPLLLALQRRWLIVAVAAATASGLTAISIAMLGLATFEAWLGSFAEVGRFMALGAYPIHRMTSIYVFALGCGLPGGLAILAHGLVAIAVMGGTARAILATGDRRIQIGLGFMSSLFLSPYVYDYDETIFGTGLILVAPLLAGRLSPPRYGLLLFCVALSQAAGVLLDPVGIQMPCAGPVLLVVYGIILRVSRKAPAAVRDPAEAGVTSAA